MSLNNNKKLSYRLDLLPVIMPFHRRAKNELQFGDLVYYGPSPEFYGIGEIVQREKNVCVVDFRGTGLLGIHKDEILINYLIPIHTLHLTGILKTKV
tara:strand:- start:476 stop:766 length:291 start_codon:yes stop_codon:yes gene_type:complete